MPEHEVEFQRSVGAKYTVMDKCCRVRVRLCEVVSNRADESRGGAIVGVHESDLMHDA